MRLVVLMLVLLGGCTLEERTDYLIGRACEPELFECDADQACLPHVWDGAGPSDFRCRDEPSFVRLPSNQDPPLAFCEPDRFVCPGQTACAPDRIRALDGGRRRMVCQVAVGGDGSVP